MSSLASFPAHLLCINHKNPVGEKKMKCLFDLVVSNGGWENNVICGKKLDLLHLAYDTIHGPTGPMNL